MHCPRRVRGVLAVLFLLGTVAAATDSLAEWVSTGGPLGGLGYDVRIHPANRNLMFVTDNFAGVIRSFDGGATWAQSNTGINVAAGGTGDAVPIFSVTIDPNNPGTVWAGTNAEGDRFGIFKSTDGGTQWALKTTGVSTEGRGIVFRGFTVQPGSSSVVYAMAELPTASQGREFNRVKGRVYKTTNGGDSWTKIWEGDNLARYLIIDPASPATLYLSTGIFDREAYNSDCGLGIPGGVGVLKSTDGGATWAPINSGLTDLYAGSLRMHPGNSRILFAATGNNACSGLYEASVVSGLFRTMDGGTSWAPVISGDIMTTVNFSPSSPEIIYAGSARAFYQSTDGGATWARYSKPRAPQWGPEGIRAGVPIDVVIDPVDPTLIYANNYGGGVFRSGDGARSWAAWSKGYSGADVHAVHIPATAPATVLAIGRSGPFKSTNSGGDWVGIANGAAQFAEWNTVVAHPANADAILITDEHQGKILRSVDGGTSFVTVLTHPAANAANPAARQGFKGLAFAPSNPDVVYAGLARERNAIDSGSPAGTVAYKSTNGGVSFGPAGPELNGRSVHRFVVHPTDAGTVWAGTTAGLFRSTNGGGNWAALGLAGRNIVGLAVDAASNYLLAGEKDGGVWISDDGGASWSGPHNTGFSSPNPFVSALVIDPASPTVAYAADRYSGVYRSTDRGRTWSPFPDAAMTGLSFRAVKDLALGPGVLYAATEGGGVFRYDGLPSTSFSITGSTSGTLSALILTADVQPAAADEGLPRNIYVAALVGPQLYFRTPSGWQRWTGGALPAYASGPMSRRTITLLDGTINMTGLLGVEFYVGYGTDENDLLANRRYAKVYTVR